MLILLLGTKVPRDESSREQKFQVKVQQELSFPGTKVLGYESSMNRKDDG